MCETSEKAVKPLKTLDLSKSATIPIIYFFGIVTPTLGRYQSQQNWKELVGSFPICEPAEKSLLEMITNHLTATQRRGGAFISIEER